MRCKRCRAFYKKYPLKKGEDGKKWHKIDKMFSVAPLQCAFGRGVFDANNWGCETMNELRDKCDYEDRDDMSAASFGVIRIPEHNDRMIQQGYIVMTWYKERGTTGQAYVMCDDDKPELLRLRTAEFAIIKKRSEKK